MLVRELLHRLHPRRAKRRIADSRFFDEAYYVETNRDVGASGMDPVEHYLKIGAKELRDTTPLLPARAPLQLDPKFWPGWTNPVLFLDDRYGDRRRSLPPAPGDIPTDVQNLLRHLRAATRNDKALPVPAVDVIIPVHNNLKRLVPLLSSLDRNTACRHTVILIDDASDEAGIAEALKNFAANRANVKLITNPRNMGYAASVNMGLAQSDNHKIILNSDAVVPAGWLDILIEPILRNPQIASVTPFSNASSYTGFPRNRIELPLPSESDLSGINEALSLFRALDREIVSGVGFCMAINARALQTLGGLDAASFRHGYFEETHWCYRASRAGFSNVLANRLCVGHDHESASFGLKRKLAALRRSQAHMRRAFRSYFEDMDAFYFADPHADLRRQSCLAVACRTARKTVVLFNDSNGDEAAAEATFPAGVATAADAVLLRIRRDSERWAVSAHTPAYGTIRLAGALPDICRLMAVLAVKQILFTPGCDTTTVEEVTGHIARQSEDWTPECVRLASDGKNVPADAPAPACSGHDAGRMLRHAPTPRSAAQWRTLAGLPAQAPPMCIAVLGTRPLATQPRQVRGLIDYVVQENKPCRVVLFGEMPAAFLADPRVCKSGIYRLDNVPAILRHHRANVAYFPRTGAFAFPFALREVLGMGLPVLTHDRGRRFAGAPDHAEWTVAPTTSARQIYEALEAMYRHYLADLGLQPG